MTFTVPDGWANYLDVPGLYLLMPPGAQPPGNNIVGSFIGVEWAVAPEAMDCRSAVPGVKRTPLAIANWIAKDHGLVVTNRHSVSVGGLKGIVLDVRMRSGAKGCLSSGATTPAVPLLVGVGPAQFDHEVAPGYAERHWLLAYEGRTLEIQAVDASGGKDLAGLAAIVRTFEFTVPRT